MWKLQEGEKTGKKLTADPLCCKIPEGRMFLHPQKKDIWRMPNRNIGPPNKDLLDLGDGGLDELKTLSTTAPLVNLASF